MEQFLFRSKSLLDYALQPIVDVHTGDLYGVEALLRNFELLNLQNPGEVFDHAWKLGCMGELESILRRKALKKFASSSISKTARLFLNVDARLSETGGFQFEQTAMQIRQMGIPPSKICFELCETSNILDGLSNEDFVGQAKAMGFALALDDYGSGYSQLKCLHTAEPDIVKIDWFFLHEIQSDSRKRLIVAAIVNLAHVLGIRVIAEGVETREEVIAARHLGCDLVQGFYFGLPTRHAIEIATHYALGELTNNDNARGLHRFDRERLAKAILPLDPLSDEASMEELLELLRLKRPLPIIPVIDAQGEPRGIIREVDIKAMLYLPFGQDLLRNKTVNNGPQKFIRRSSIADMGTNLDDLIAMIGDGDEQSDGIIMTHNGRYKGFLSTYSLLRIANEIRIRVAEDQNPLTRLPGNGSVTSFILGQAQRTDVARTFCYMDFDNFKPFNDTYGFQTGDRALLLFSDLAKQIVGSTVLPHGFLGHIGGDDFFLGTTNEKLENVLAALSTLAEKFRHQAESFYEAQHRALGYIVSHDRSGHEHKFPLLSCSVGVLHLPVGVSVSDEDQLWRSIAGLKLKAKTDGTGLAITIMQSPEQGNNGWTDALRPERMRAQATQDTACSRRQALRLMRDE